MNRKVTAFVLSAALAVTLAVPAFAAAETPNVAVCPRPEPVAQTETAAGETAGQIPAVLLKPAYLTLLPGILISSDDYRPLVLPQIQNTFPFPAEIQQILFHRKIMIRNQLTAFKNSDRLNHASSSV